MQYQRSAIDVAGRSGPRCSGDGALLAPLAPRPGRRPALGTRSARKPRSGPAWLAFTLCVALFPAVGQGQTVEWAKSHGGAARDLGAAIAVDNQGNSYVTGNFSGTVAFGTLILTSAGDTDIFVAKYDDSGTVLWAKSARGDDG